MATWRDVMIPGGKHPWHFFSASPEIPTLQVSSRAAPAERQRELLDGLLAEQPVIAPKFLYDAQGCALYSAITQLEEYYPVRTEAALFTRYREEIASYMPRRSQWVDLGCSDGGKSWAWVEAVGAARYVGVDIAEEWLQLALREGRRRCPGVDTLGIVADFTRPLELQAVKAAARKLPPVFFYPGSSIGNFTPGDTLHFLQSIQQHLGEHGQLLISVDGLHEPEMLQAAYDDALGVTAAFNRNVLRVVNRELDATFDPALFRHHAVFNADESRIEMCLEARETHTVRLGRQRRRFYAGDSIVTEYAYKYSGEAFNALLEVAGFGNIRRWHNADRSYHVFLAGVRKLS
ncbi:MAG: transporter ATP-binding protein [Moraxellaceae bacterium]|jgi:dimethylhistidine N-methyltransferase|nr:transporter ATP-binding protein [Moraxellaceae bacterium]